MAYTDKLITATRQMRAFDPDAQPIDLYYDLMAGLANPLNLDVRMMSVPGELDGIAAPCQAIIDAWKNQEIDDATCEERLAAVITEETGIGTTPNDLRSMYWQ